MDWDNDGTYDETGITGNVTHDFVVAGTYTIRVRGTFPRIYFNLGGDRRKLLDVGQWGDQAWTSMASAFNGCTNLQISATDLPNLGGVTDLSFMFSTCTILNGPTNIGNWNTALVTNMSSMFRNTLAFNQPIGNWNTALVTSMARMFRNATAFDQTIGNWTLHATVNLSNMLNNSGLDCTNYSATLIGWSDNPLTPNGRSLGATGRQYGTNAVTARSNLTTTKTWTITGDAASGAACPIPLPVGWLAFTGEPQSNGVLLQWQTASEQNNAGFYIERSADGFRWIEIGFVAGKGTTTATQHYSFLDEKPLGATPLQGGRGANYYRLRQTDINGNEELSPVVSVVLQNIGTVRVFPNPVSNGALSLFLPGNVEEEVTVQLFSPVGQCLRSMTLMGVTNTMDITELPNGIYTLQVGHSFEKIVVQH